MTTTELRGIWVKLRHTPLLLIAQKLLRRVPLRPFDIGKLCFLLLAGIPDVPDSLSRGPGSVRQGTREDLAALVRLQPKETVFLERFAAGDHCVVAVVEGCIVGYEWFSDQPVHHEAEWHYRILIPEGFIYAYDAYIHPAHRNTGLWLRFKRYLADEMSTSGKHCVLTFVDYGNWPSFRTHLRFGFKPAETVLAMKVLRWRVTRTLRG